MSTHHDRNMIGLAAEYAVAAELCRRGIYAQLTLGHQKKTDLLVFSQAGLVARVEVKAKLGGEWPNCKGIAGPRVFIVFVDYENRDPADQPDFYVLSVRDWRAVLERRVEEIRAKSPKRRIEITSENVAVFPDQIRAGGRPYEGMSIRPPDIERHRDRWGKVSKAIRAG